MKSYSSASALLLAAVLLGGCFPLQDKPKTASVFVVPETTAEQTPAVLQPQTVSKKSNQNDLPELLGGAVSSDSWIVYKDEGKEEFKGNVSYDNGQYIFRAGYALSERKKQQITAENGVYARRNEPNGVWYELYANRVVYNYKTGQGTAQAAFRKRIKLIYRTERGDLITAWAKKAAFNTRQETFELIDNVQVNHIDPQGQHATLQADRISGRQKEQYALLKGHAEAYNDSYRLQADTLEYDGLQQTAYAYGDRPLVQGTTEDGTFAIIADKVTLQTDSRDTQLDGQVQGWVVSEQLKQSVANKTL